MHRTFLPLLFFLLLIPAFAEAPWVSVTVPSSAEAETVASLEAQGVTALAWSNTVVEVSAFDGIELLPLAALDRRLTPQDPRWDPWLRNVVHWFQPRAGYSRIWVSQAAADRARTVLGERGDASEPKPIGITAPLITGWALVALALLGLSLMLATGLLSGWLGWEQPRRWVGVAAAVVFFVWGSLLIGGAGPRALGAPPKAEVSWLQHRWFQEAWPWGASWDDYAPDRAWTFRSYEHKDGKLAEVDAKLSAADESWAETARKGLDPHHAERIFGSANP